MPHLSHTVFALLAGIFLSNPAFGQADLPFSLDVPLGETTAYNPAVPTHEQVLGFEIGRRHAEPHDVVDYFEAVSETSDRVTLRRHAVTVESRSLIHAVVTSPENHAQLEEIRRTNLRLSEDPESVSDDELATMPAVVYMGYSVHGNEASGSEAALLLIYHLAAGEGAGVQRILENAVVIIDPMLNPDGRDRFTSWANRNRGAVPVADPADREHDEPWPGGRTNHYWFDLNRDWLPVQHPESQGRIQLFHHWRPQLLTDHHEMEAEATFFFQPGIPSRDNPNTPERTIELTGRLGTYHAAALDDIGSLYYTKESYDDFYYGKGSTYPDINGSVGILFEQASSRALERETERGTLTYPFTVRNQFVTSLSTLEGLLEMKDDFLRHQRDFYASSLRAAASFETQAYVIDRSDDPSRAAELADVLRRHRIRIHELASAVQAGGRTFRPGHAFVVPVAQPQARLIKAALERTTTFPDSLFYDVSTWTLPLAFGLPYAELEDAPSRLIGDEIANVERPQGRIVGGASPYGYAFEWGSYFAPRAVYALQEAGLSIRILKKPMTAAVSQGETSFGYGTVIIPARQVDVTADAVHRLVEDEASRNGLTVYALQTGLATAGPDLGSREAAVLEKPVVALITGESTSAYRAGEAWHLLSERFRIPVSLIDAADAGRIDLSRYNTMVLAGGSYSLLSHEAVRAWTTAGGRLILLTDAVDWGVENGIIQLTSRKSESDSLYRGVAYADLPSARGAQRIGGSIFRAKLDVTHPLAFGYDDEVAVFRSGESFYEPSETPGTNVAIYADEPLISGYISDQLLPKARGAASIVADRLGSGRAIAIHDNPNFRAFWYGTNGLFLNAVFLGATF